MTKFLIADDHPLIREGIRGQLSALEAGALFVEARDWKETFAAGVDPELDLALIDLNMPGREGLAALAELLRANPALPVLVLSASERTQDMRDALRVGAMGYVTKNEPSAVLLAAIRLVLEGGMYVPPALADLGARGKGLSPAAENPAPPATLTERQLDVLRLIVEGKSNSEIAEQLHVALATVKVHLAAIFRALDVVNRTQAAVSAARLGLHLPPKSR